MAPNLDLTLTCDLGDLGHAVDIEFTAHYAPAIPASGYLAPPENFDPGAEEELTLLSAAARLGRQTLDLTPLFAHLGLAPPLAQELAEAYRSRSKADASGTGDQPLSVSD